MAQQHMPQIVTDGLSILFNAGNPASYPGSGTGWKGLATGETATLVNTPTFSSNKLGYLTFNGTNQYCTSTKNVTGRPFTLNAWFYFNSLSGFQTIIGQNSTTPGLSSFWFQKITDGAPGAGRTSNTLTFTGIDGDCTDPTPVTTGVWYNYCASIATSGTVLYKNGVQVASLAGSAAMNPPSSMVLGTGYFNNGLADYSRVNLTYVSIYNKSLSASEISQNFNALRGRFNV